MTQTFRAPQPEARSWLGQLAAQALRDRGLLPEFPAAVLAQARAMRSPQREGMANVDDLTALPWCSIDNDDSRDLDQLSACEALTDGACKLSVAVADVDALVTKDSAIDQHAGANTASIYTSARIFPMLPEQLSAGLSSLNPGEDRLALVTDMVIAPDASIPSFKVRRAWVRNQAQLAYDSVSSWLEGRGPLPQPAMAVPGMDQQLRMQDDIAQRLRARRRAQGSLELETFAPQAVFDGERVIDLRQQVHNRARQLIEELMIATNTCTASLLARHGGASLRRVVRSPERWQRIINLARRYGERLPQEPDSRALEIFLANQHRADPLHFADLSLIVVKLMGAGEYVVESPTALPIGHFGLALRGYTHSTAPNRRYPDLISQRMVKSLLAGHASPYSALELQHWAAHCTAQEDAARKVERHMHKCEAAMYLSTQIGRHFDAIVTGRTTGGTWVRLLSPPAEGMLLSALPDLDIGQQLRVRLVSTDAAQGFVDFALSHQG